MLVIKQDSLNEVNLILLVCLEKFKLIITPFYLYLIKKNKMNNCQQLLGVRDLYCKIKPQPKSLSVLMTTIVIFVIVWNCVM